MSIFKEQKITGLMFLTLTPEELEHLVPILGERKTISNLITTLKVKSKEEITAKVMHAYKDLNEYSQYLLYRLPDTCV